LALRFGRPEAAVFRAAPVRRFAVGARFAGRFPAGRIAGSAGTFAGACRFGRGVRFFGTGAAAAASAACRASSVTSVATG
jgi:hypothetical protein